MKIVKLTAENVKRLIAVEITPDGSVVTIGGKNGAGKSSVLDSIAYALGGKTLVPDKPIRDGEKFARIEVDLGEMIVIREFSQKETSIDSGLVIKNKEGLTFPSPQKLLDKLMGKLSFDPLLFVRSSDKNQLETLRDLVGLDTMGLDSKRQIVYHNRTELNRKIKAEEAQLELYPHHSNIPKEMVSMKEVSDAMLKAEKLRKEVEEQKQISEKKQATITNAQISILECEAKMDQLKHSISLYSNSIKEAEAIVVKEIEIPDTKKIRERITEIEEVNKKIHQNKIYFAAANHLVEQMKDAEDFTKSIDELDEEKKALLRKVVYPIKGLELSDEGVLFNNIPFKQCSTAEQLKVSVAMGLALNPKLKILLVRDGNALDSFSLKEVAKLAEEADAQLWLERVSEDGEDVSVMIEEGEVKKNG